MTSFYTMQELEKLKFKSIGKDVFISRKASIYSPEKISIGNHVRIDDFSILSGEIDIGNYVHIAAYVALYGKYGIKIGNYSGISSRSILYSAVDDYSGDYLISPMVENKYTNLFKGKIIMGNYTQVGANSIILPCVNLLEGAVCGAFSLVKKDLDSWGIYAGIPAKKIKDRSKNLIKLVAEIENNKSMKL